MIFLGGKPLVSPDEAEMDTLHPENLLERLLEHPAIVASAIVLKGSEFQRIKAPHPSGNEDDSSVEARDGAPTGLNFVYVFQKEFATVNPQLVRLIGTDEMTTCIGVVMRDPSTGLTSVGHFDTKESAVTGVNQLATSVASTNCSSIEIHLVGAYDDRKDYNDEPPCLTSDTEEWLVEEEDEEGAGKPGWSRPLVLQMIATLQRCAHKFEMGTCCILHHNTLIQPSGYACPAVRGFVVDTLSGQVIPAIFESEARGPDYIVRRLSVTTAVADPAWQPSLLSPYETASDTFVISPCKWNPTFEHYAAYMLSLSDLDFLQRYSTSPHAEHSDFVVGCKRVFAYMQKFPNWEQTFCGGQPRIFTRTSEGGWIQRRDSIQSRQTFSKGSRDGAAKFDYATT